MFLQWNGNGSVGASPFADPVENASVTAQKWPQDRCEASRHTFGHPMPKRLPMEAVDREIVRAEFLKAYPAKNRKAKEMAFLRCEIDAVARSIAGHRAIGAEGSENAVYWLLK
jgi:hypothetical protein